MIEKVEKTMTENGQSYIRCIAIDKSEKRDQSDYNIIN